MTVATAMILAAGLGTRLRPVTETTPKPLLRVAGRPLIEHHLERLSAAGIRRVVVNLHHLGSLLRTHLGDGSRWDLEIVYSEEPQLLETAGGIRAALPLLGEAPFLVVNGDVFCDLDPTSLLTGPGEALCHLVMVPTPPWRSHGDFNLAPNPPGPDHRFTLVDGGRRRLTYSGIGVYDPAMFRDLEEGPLPLRPLFEAGIAAGRITGELHEGYWDDIGTRERLRAARARFGD